MAYTTATKVRSILGVDSTDAPDAVLDPFILDATKIVIRRTSVRILDETITSINAADTIFETEHCFLADRDGDAVIDKNDIQMYTWTDMNDEDTKSPILAANITSFHGLTGQIKLSADPDTLRGETVDKVSIDYNYYRNQMNFDLAALATAYYAGKMWVERELLLVPKQYKVGRVMMKGKDYWKRLDTNFERTMHMLVVLPMDKVTYKIIMKGARESTLQEEMDQTKKIVKIPEDIC